MSTNPNFLLTPQQQELLFAALNANRPAGSVNSMTLSPTSLDGSPTLSKPAGLVGDSFPENAFLDYDYSFDAGDSSLDFGDASNMTDAMGDGANDDSKTESSPSTNGNDSPDKRVHPEDDDDEESAAKRREGGEKIPKKPGRKPLTSEPSSKRKAQNRAAQRAFRERKEKHVKDLETKVEELERASAMTSSENSQLRSKVERMTAQLNEYKKRLAVVNTSRPTYSAPSIRQQQFGKSIISNISDVNFQFEFPKFGQLPGPSTSTAATTAASIAASTYRPSTIDTTSPPALDKSTSTASAVTSSHVSPLDTSRVGLAKTAEDLSKMSNAFTPPLTSSSIVNTSRSSLDSGATSSPSASSNTNTAPSSSCGTSPEPCNLSPSASKPLETLTTIGEEQPTILTGHDHSQFGDVNINEISWPGSQNGFRFDPQLFGDYREPQENVLANGGFDDSFFNDALEVDFLTPFNVAPSPVLNKSDLLAQIDAAKEAEFSSSSLNASGPDHKSPPIPSTPHGTLLTCNTIWERLQTCPKVQNGDFDLDGLCSDLQKKAKCSGSGAVVDETDFKAVMNKYLGKEGDDPCVQKLAASLH